MTFLEDVSCVQKENFYANYASLEHTTNLQTVSITAELTTEIFEGYSCWIDVNEVSVIVEYFILWLGSQYEDGLPESVIETTIALALNGKSLNLNNEGSHRLLLQNVLVEDVICRKSESSISCRLLPHHLKIHWIVSSNGADAIIKTISPSEKLRFSGVFGSCNKTPLFIQIDGDQRTSHDVHILRYYKGRLDTESILRDFLQRAFIKRCDMLRAFEV
ncbi:hypothetical protein SprV_0501828300 [Sparganum proliferum]